MSSLDRQPLLGLMSENAARGINCAACAGECCTSLSNSMQITVTEAQDCIDDLQSRNLLDAQLSEKIFATIAEYRLDIEIPSFGSRPNLRRTYTCPLYTGQKHGCLLQMHKKPLGCLAFNPNRTGSTGLSSGCSSNQSALEKCAPDGAKAPLPVALWNILAQ